MNEEDYCTASDLARVRIAQSVMREIVPNCGHTCVPREEWESIMQTLYKWSDKLYKIVDGSMDNE